MHIGAHYIMAAAIVACPMHLDWNSSAQSYTPGQHVVVCADTLRIINGKVIVETKGDGLFRSGFER